MRWCVERRALSVAQAGVDGGRAGDLNLVPDGAVGGGPAKGGYGKKCGRR